MPVSKLREVIDKRRLFGMFSIVSGVLSIALLLGSLLTPPQTSPSQFLAFVSSNFSIVIVSAVLILGWMAFSVPFVVCLGNLLKSKDQVLSQTATFLSAGGILLESYGSYTGIDSFLTIAATKGAPSQAATAYQFALSMNTYYALTDPGLMAWGLGQLLFGWLAWKSGIMPNWIAIIGFIGGVSGILASLSAPPLGPVFAYLAIAIFGIWALTAGVLLLRHG